MHYRLYYFLFVAVQLFYCQAFGQDTIIKAARPDTLQTPAALINTTPLSDIDIPVRIGLKPFYDWANLFIDTLYTSKNYPIDWVQNGCDTRYQYRFVRGPFQFKTYNNLLLMSFSGYYRVRGSTRFCSGTSSFSPWTPPCSCGSGTETPRRIDAGFVIKFKINPDYSIGLFVQRTDPVPVNKCEVCFFGKDITQIVAQQLKSDLDSSVVQMQQKMKLFSLKPYLQMLWDTLQAGYKVPSLGVVNFRPQQIRIGQVILQKDTMYCSLGLSARPSLEDVAATGTLPLPQLSDFALRNGIQLFTQLHLPYDSLSRMTNAKMGGTEIQVGKSIFKKTIRIDSVKLLGGGNKMFVQVFLSKGVKGTVFLEGVPNYDPVTQQLKMDSLNFHMQSRQLLVRTASWLLDGAIEKKIKEACRFELGTRLKNMQNLLTVKMNQQLYAGIRSKGYLSKLVINKIILNPGGIDIGAAASGRLLMDIDGAALLKSYMK